MLENAVSWPLNLAGRVAVITGASQGVGRGIALALGDAGATVYFTGRNREALEAVSAQVAGRGGQPRAMICDHADDAQVTKLFERVSEEERGIDLLVNNVWGGYEAHPTAMKRTRQGSGPRRSGSWGWKIGTRCSRAAFARISRPAAWRRL
jgi:NAD(P)-dependent dehydrogenase (short-subunit alcohol dehydrogenase family)